MDIESGGRFLDAILLSRANPFYLFHLYSELELFEGTEKYDGDLTTYFEDFLRKGVDPNDIDFSSYEIYRDFAPIRKWGGTFRSEHFLKYYDARYNFVLTCGNREAIASIGFNPSGTGNIMVNQIQGQRGCKEELEPFRWEKMLLMLVVDWAKRYGLKEVRVQPAEFNEYTWTGIGRLKMLYDITSQRCGFKRRDVWSPLSNTPKYYYFYSLS